MTFNMLTAYTHAHATTTPRRTPIDPTERACM